MSQVDCPGVLKLHSTLYYSGQLLKASDCCEVTKYLIMPGGAHHHTLRSNLYLLPICSLYEDKLDHVQNPSFKVHFDYCFQFGYVIYLPYPLR